MRPAAELPAIRIQDFSVQVHLGCSAEERSRPQEVLLSVELRFRSEPEGAVSDTLAGTICYGELCALMREVAEGQGVEFNLVEKLATDCLRALRAVVGDRATIGLSAHKVNPPVPGLRGGAIYFCGDFRL